MSAQAVAGKDPAGQLNTAGGFAATGLHRSGAGGSAGWRYHIFGSVVGYVQLDGLRVWVRLVAQRLV